MHLILVDIKIITLFSFPLPFLFFLLFFQFFVLQFWQKTQILGKFVKFTF
jgi:hypothetical protein